MSDYDTRLDLDSFTVTADFAVNESAAGENLARHFRTTAEGVWGLKLTAAAAKAPPANASLGSLVVAIKDRQGNLSRIERLLRIGEAAK